MDDTGMNKDGQEAAKTTDAKESGSAATSGKRRIDWENPKVPVGNAPPLPRWPLYVSGLAWAGWVLFLFFLVLSVNRV